MSQQISISIRGNFTTFGHLTELYNALLQLTVITRGSRITIYRLDSKFTADCN